MDIDVMKLLHEVDPYKDYMWRGDIGIDLQGWGGHPEFFRRMIELTAPKLIIEVGTWKGRSALAMAQILDDISKEIVSPESTRTWWCEETKIMCVDTWLGATEMWTNHDDEKRYKSLRLVNGYPSLYYTFMNNVVGRAKQHRIVPFPQTSQNAARVLRKAGVKAQLIYIDASHEEQDVKFDLWAWKDMLDEGGIMFGDDYCDYWPGVKSAVNAFAERKAMCVQTRRYENPGSAPSDYWVLSKDGIDLP